MQIANVNTRIVASATKLDPAPPTGGKVGFSAAKSVDGKVGFTPPSYGKIGRFVDVKA